ncbi:MAG: purine-nucleoside phosphorylase [bacterium]|nr:purine-nucleoside phosphorylase [bacterium]
MRKNKIQKFHSKILLPQSAIKETVAYIHSQCNILPQLGIVLGSGLGNVADRIIDCSKTVIPYSSIPHFPQPTVAGHHGNLVLGLCQNIPIAIMQGRFHLYEGHTVETILYPIQILAKLGVETLILTNAAGGLNPKIPVGSLVIIKDQINFMFIRLGDDFTQWGRPIYDERLIQLALNIAKKEKLQVATGVYIGAKGPSYETPAEIRMFQKMGADMIGMSTVLESIAANELGMKVLGISCITNLGAGITPAKLTHEEVLDISQKTSCNLSILITELVKNIE